MRISLTYIAQFNINTVQCKKGNKIHTTELFLYLA